MQNVVKIQIWTDSDQTEPSYALPDVPWYPGISVLQAMIIGEALHTENLTFRVEYRSIYGAFIDSIDNVADDPAKNLYWMLYVNGEESTLGATETILLEDDSIHEVTVDWRYLDISKTAHPQSSLKTKSIR